MSKEGFATGNVNWERKVDSSNGLATLKSQLQTKVAGTNASIPLSLYYGPNDFEILKAFDKSNKLNFIYFMVADLALTQEVCIKQQ